MHLSALAVVQNKVICHFLQDRFVFYKVHIPFFVRPIYYLFSVFVFHDVSPAEHQVLILIYFGNIDGRFFALDPRSGDELWRFQTQGEIWSSPAVAGEGVYFGSYDSNLYALRRQGPQLALAPTATSRPLLPTPTMLPKSDQPIPVGTAGQPWWNDRIFYEVFVRSFKDSNGDGNGDLKGLISQLDYLNDGDPATTQDLGVTGLWLMPVTESPSYHGYDVMDYKTVEQDYGTNEDVKQLIAEAHKRGMVVIVDLVMNHTSSQHPWFVEAQQPGSEHENWYIWQNENPAYLSLGGRPYGISSVPVISMACFGRECQTSTITMVRLLPQCLM
jgi:hypothetical protein